MSIRARLLLAFAGVLLPYLALVAIGVVSFPALSQRFHSIEQEVVEHVEGLTDLRLAILQLIMPANDYLITGDPREREEFERQLAQTRGALARIENFTLQDPKARQLLEAVGAQVWQMETLSREILAVSDPRADHSAHAAAHAKMKALDRLGAEAATVLMQVREIEYREIRENVERGSGLGRRSAAAALAALVLSLAGGMALAFLFARWLGRPLEAIAHGSRRIAQGDLSQRVEVGGGGEAGEAADAFNTMAGRLEASHAALRRTNEELEGVNSIAAALTSTLELGEIFKTLTQRTAQAVGAERCSLSLWRDGHLVPVMSQYADGHLDPALWEKFKAMGPYELEEVPVHAEAIRTKRPVAIEDATTSPLYPARLVETFGVRAALLVPLVRQDQVLGTLMLDQTRGPWRWTQAQIGLAMTIAGQAALAVENARLYEASEARRRAAETLAAIGGELAQSLDLAVVGQRITDGVRELLHASSSAFFRQASQPGCFVLVTISGDTGVAFKAGQIVPEEAGPLAFAAREGRLTASPDILNDPRFRLAPEVRDGIEQAPFRAVLMIPLLVEGRAMGALAISDRAGRTFSDEEIRLAQVFANQATLALENARLYEASEARSRQAQALAAIGRDLGQSLDLAMVGQRIIESVRQLLRVRFSSLYRLEPGSGDLVVVAVSENMAPIFGPGVVFPKGVGAIGLAVKEGRVVVSEDVLADPRVTFTPEVRARVEQAGFRAIIALPLLGKEGVLGVLGIGDEPGRVFAAEEIGLAQAFADQAALALQNARLVEDLRNRQARLEALIETSRVVLAIQTREALLGKIAEACGHLLGSDSVGFRLLEGEDLVISASWGDAREAMVTPRIKIGQGLTGRVAATGQPLIVPDVARDDRVLPEHREVLRRLGHRAWLGVPVKVGERLVGVLSVRTPRERGFTGEDLVVAEAFASQAAIALENARLFEETQRALADLKTAQQQLIEGATMRALGELASGAAHHLNNLMAIVLGRVRLLLSGPESAPVRRPLEVIERAATDAAEVVRRVSRFARTQPLEDWQPLDLRQVASEVLEFTRARWQDAAQAQGIRIEAALEGPDVPPVMGNGAALREVLLNLMLNAVEALPEGGKIAVRTFSEEGWVGVSVRDSGAGMSPEVRERALEPFFTTKGPRSTGLGLSESYGILQRHGGKLTIETAEGQGTTVTIHLPVDSALAKEVTQPEPPRSGAPALSIVVIDDDDEVREVVAEMLAAQGHRVLQAVGGREGLALLEAGETLDLVLTDLGMPGMTGWDVARAVRMRWPGLPVGMLTGWGEQIDEASPDRQMVAGVLSKPATPEGLREFVATCHSTSRGV